MYGEEPKDLIFHCTLCTVYTFLLVTCLDVKLNVINAVTVTCMNSLPLATAKVAVLFPHTIVLSIYVGSIDLHSKLV